ncbi:hypothetical protein PoB_005357800 [Plakobranchus ocellatus]|uniref:CUB domain-containing protein n=1 Tax=Plakobranchus ocellatus TaxID=259542 RepID=A0AAV4C7U9_9GAST|nr:hypothetical protein PoB_005357800 [Plakobranchus ocellatus]
MKLHWSTAIICVQIFETLLLFICDIWAKPDTIWLENSCRKTVEVSASKIVQLNSWRHLDSASHEPCVLELSAFSPYHSSLLKERVRISLLALSIPGSPPQCQVGHLDIVDSDKKTPLSGPFGLCGKHGRASWLSSNNNAYISVKSSNSSSYGHFQLLVTSFNTYLSWKMLKISKDQGAVLTKEGDGTEDIKVRKDTATSAITKPNKITKLKLYKALVV